MPAALAETCGAKKSAGASLRQTRAPRQPLFPAYRLNHGFVEGLLDLHKVSELHRLQLLLLCCSRGGDGGGDNEDS